jgi:prepilin-type N-terminal cleavage/methylation domain-containing protein
MKRRRVGGFTLIELLTVIAILAILAALTAVAIPRVLERARIADVQTDFRTIATALTQYLSDHASYPPGYGFTYFGSKPVGPNNPITFKHTSYLEDTNLYGETGIYDRFSQNHDTNSDDVVSLLEFVPLITNSTAPSYARDVNPFPTPVPIDPPYPINNNCGGTFELPVSDLNCMQRRGSSQRPYIYIPFNQKHLDRMKDQVWRNDPNYPNGEPSTPWTWTQGWDSAFNPPPNPKGTLAAPQYDGFVLVGVGPLTHTHGVIDPPGSDLDWLNANGIDPVNWYHIVAMGAAYLATRDFNDNGVLDFDFVARSRNSEGGQLVVPGDPAASINLRKLPDGTQLYGPMIYRSS